MFLRRASISVDPKLSLPGAKGFWRNIFDSLPNRRHCVFDKLVARHLVLDIGHVEVGVQKDDGIANRVNDIGSLEAVIRVAIAPSFGKSN